MKLLVHGLVFGFVCTAAFAAAVPTTIASSGAEQQQQQQQEGSGTATLPPSVLQQDTTTQQQTEGGTTSPPSSSSSSSSSSSMTTTTNTTTTITTTAAATFPAASSDSNQTDTNQQQHQEQQTIPPGIGGNQTTECGGLLEASECINAAYHDMVSSLFFFVFDQNVENLVNDMCLKYENHRYCVKAALVPCSGPERVRYDVGMAAFDFICSPAGRATVREAWPCLSEGSVGQYLRLCSEKVANISASNYSPCRIAEQYVGCVSSTFNQRCSTQSADAIQELLMATLSPFSSFFNCPAPTTTTPTSPSTSTTTTESVTTTMPLTTTATSSSTTTTTAATTPSTTEEMMTTTKMMPTTTTTPETTTTTTTAAPTTTTTRRPAEIGCYDCNTGINGYWPNPKCTEAGYIDNSTVAKTPCGTECFARINSGGVFRGCSQHHLYALRNIAQRTGCHQVNNGYYMETWCFCNSEGCNTQDMSHFVSYY